MALTKIAASMVQYTPATGQGATLQVALRAELRNVNLFFIGGESDATAMFNRASAAARSVYVPAGTYTLSSAAWPANTEFFGDGDNSILQMPASAAYLISVDSGSASVANNITNLRMRDLQVRATVAVDGFSEFKHLVSLNGVTDASFDRVLFYGFRGDGLYIGSGNVGGQERHNKRVRVRNCRFDGVNRDNRNGISIIDCDDGTFRDNYFVNTTRDDMPGAIDIEPDSGLFHIVRNLKLQDNSFYNCRVAIQAFITTYFTKPCTKFVITGNHAENCKFGYLFDQSSSNAAGGGLSEASVDTDLVIRNNTAVNCDTPLYVRGVKGAKIEANEFQDCINHAYIGDGGFNRLYSFDILYAGNRHIRCGSTSQFGLVVDGTSGLRLRDNRFADCGNGAVGSAGINFLPSFPGAVSLREFSGNDFTSATAKMLNAVTETGAGTVVYTVGDVFRNVYNGLPSYFPAESGAFTPQIDGTTTAGAGTYTVQIGRWFRVGNTCFWSVDVTMSAHTGTGGLVLNLTTIPFASKNVDGNHFIPCTVTSSAMAVGAGKVYGAAMQNNSRIVSLYVQDQAGAGIALLTPGLDTSFSTSISGSYEI